MAINTMEIFKDGGTWVAGFPRLGIYSQGETRDEATRAAREALRLWFVSCIERGTLAAALEAA